MSGPLETYETVLWLAAEETHRPFERADATAGLARPLARKRADKIVGVRSFGGHGAAVEPLGVASGAIHVIDLRVAEVRHQESVDAADSG